MILTMTKQNKCKRREAACPITWQAAFFLRVNSKDGGKTIVKNNLRNEVKAYIVRQGMTMQQVTRLLQKQYGWKSGSVSNLSNKLQRESLRYVEAVQLADALGYEIVWQKRQ